MWNTVVNNIMENLLLLSESQVAEIAQRVLGKTIEQVKEALDNDFTKEMHSWLFELHMNAESDVLNGLVKKVADGFADNPKDYKYKELRDKIYHENKEAIHEAILESDVDRMIAWRLIHCVKNEGVWRNRFHGAVVRFILENQAEFVESEKIKEAVLSEVNRLKEEIAYLKTEINRLQNQYQDAD